MAVGETGPDPGPSAPAPFNEAAAEQASAAQPKVLLTVSAEALNLRSEPSMAGTIVGSYPRGTTATELRRQGNWVEVRIEEMIGWMSTRYLDAAEN